MFPKLLEPRAVVSVGPFGFMGRGMFDETAFRRAPTPKIRMQVLKRDDRRCRICGRRPDDNSDLELHIHHIRPWEKGGITDPSNLITLCHTCHKGLMPHADHQLFDYLSKTPDDPVQAVAQDFRRSVANYRKVGFFGGLDETKAKRLRPRPSRK